MIEVTNLCFQYNNNEEVLKNINIDIPKEAIAAVLGPSGCGKTTLLKILGGLLQPKSGNISGRIPHGRISYVFQESRLLPWKTVNDNLSFILKDKMDAQTRRKLIDQYLRQVELNEYREYYPHQLSGGMRQRVSLARAFAYPSELMLLDEPFRSLDPNLKLNLMHMFTQIWEKDRRTTVFVTHDVLSSVLLGDYIYILSQRPGEVRYRITNPIPQNQRRADCEEVFLLEKKIYQYLTEKA